MNLLEYLAIAAALLPVLYIWCKPLGVCAILLAFMVPGYIYVWAGLEIVTYLWSWALPLAAGLIVLIPTYRWVYIRVSRCVNGWSKLTMEVEDSRGHVHYIKRIDDQTYINGGSGTVCRILLVVSGLSAPWKNTDAMEETCGSRPNIFFNLPNGITFLPSFK